MFCFQIFTRNEYTLRVSQHISWELGIDGLEEVEVIVLVPRHKLLCLLLKHIAEEEVPPQGARILVRTDPNLILSLHQQATKPSFEDPQRTSLHLLAHVPPRVEKRLTVFVLRLVPWRNALWSRGKRR